MPIQALSFSSIAAVAALLAMTACDGPNESAERPPETVQFQASAYPYFHSFWDPIRDRVTEKTYTIVIEDGDKSHQFTCHPMDEVAGHLTMHVSKASIHIGSGAGESLEDVTQEELKTVVQHLTTEAKTNGTDPIRIGLHVRTNVSGERVHEILRTLARAGVHDLVAPTPDSEKIDDAGGPLLQDDASSP